MELEGQSQIRALESMEKEKKELKQKCKDFKDYFTNLRKIEISKQTLKLQKQIVKTLHPDKANKLIHANQELKIFKVITMINLPNLQSIKLNANHNQQMNIQFIGYIDAPLLQNLQMSLISIVSLYPLKKLYSNRLKKIKLEIQHELYRCFEELQRVKLFTKGSIDLQFPNLIFPNQLLKLELQEGKSSVNKMKRIHKIGFKYFMKQQLDPDSHRHRQNKKYMPEISKFLDYITTRQ